MKDWQNITVGISAAAVVISLLACSLPKDGPQTDNTVYDPNYSGADAGSSEGTADAGSSQTVNLSETNAKPAPGLEADRLDLLSSGLSNFRKMVRSRTTDPAEWSTLVPEGKQVRFRGAQADSDQKFAAAGLADAMSAAYGGGLCVPAQAECFSHCCSYQPGDAECEGHEQAVSAACFTGESADTLALSELWMRCPVRYDVEDIDAKPGCLTDFEVRSDDKVCDGGASLTLLMKNNCAGSLEAGKQKVGANDKTGFVLGECKDEICDFKVFGTAGAKPLDVKVRVRARSSAPSNFEAELVGSQVR